MKNISKILKITLITVITTCSKDSNVNYIGGGTVSNGDTYVSGVWKN